MSIRKLLLAIIINVLFLCGCGSSSNTSLGRSDQTVRISGFAVDGYLADSNVGIDSNLNGTLDDGEVLTKTNKDGSFSFVGPSDNRGPILVQGGTDSTLNIPFKGILSSQNPQQHTSNLLVNPLTTLLNNGMEETRLKSILSIPDNIDVHKMSDESINLIIRKGIKIHTLAILLETATKSDIRNVYSRLSQTSSIDQTSIRDLLLILGSSNASPVASVIHLTINEMDSVQTMDDVTSVQGIALTTTVSAIGDFRDGLIHEDELMKSKPSIKPLTVQSLPTMKNSIGMEFVRIKSGTFLMGAPADLVEEMRDPSQGPRHEVTISRDFYIGKYEVTQSQWEQVLGVASNHSSTIGTNLPVDNASLDQINEFISILNSFENDGIYRLPTEAEWEYAARAGYDSITFFGANNLHSTEVKNWNDQYAWHNNNSLDDEGMPHIQAVGLKLPNSWGLYDVVGNVGELVLDTYSDPYTFWDRVTYESQPVIDPLHIENSASERIVYIDRGGSINSTFESFSVTKRFIDFINPKYGATAVGFRLIKEINP